MLQPTWLPQQVRTCSHSHRAAATERGLSRLCTMGKRVVQILPGAGAAAGGDVQVRLLLLADADGERLRCKTLSLAARSVLDGCAGCHRFARRLGCAMPLSDHRTVAYTHGGPLGSWDTPFLAHYLSNQEHHGQRLLAGKTTFIKYLLGGRDYPGINIGPEPTTDRFVVVEHGLEERRTPGNTLVVQPSKPYQASGPLSYDSLLACTYAATCQPHGVTACPRQSRICPQCATSCGTCAAC